MRLSSPQAAFFLNRDFSIAKTLHFPPASHDDWFRKIWHRALASGVPLWHLALANFSLSYLCERGIAVFRERETNRNLISPYLRLQAIIHRLRDLASVVRNSTFSLSYLCERGIAVFSKPVIVTGWWKMQSFRDRKRFFYRENSAFSTSQSR
jgi:hypothetical protein